MNLALPPRAGWWVMLIDKYGELGILLGLAILGTIGYILITIEERGQKKAQARAASRTQDNG